MEWFETIKFLLIASVIGVILFELIRLAILGKRAVQAGKNTKRFSNKNSANDRNILIFGDSTSYGTGASSPEKSLVGQLAKDFPKFNVVNESENGFSIAQVRKKMSSLGKLNADVIMIHTGGIDTTSFTPYGVFRKELASVLTTGKEHGAKKVILVSVNNTGSPPFFRTPLNQIYTNRSRRISKLCHEVSLECDAVHVPLFREKREDPLFKNGVWRASYDQIHTDDSGYGIWYQEIKRVIKPHLNSFNN